MSEGNGRLLKISGTIIGILLTICGVLVMVGFSVHSEADLQDRTDIKQLTVQGSKLEIGLAEMKEDVGLIRKDVRDMKVYLFTGALP